MDSPFHPAGAALIQQTLATVAADTALREAEAAHGPVTQVWFDPFTVRDRYALGHWHRLVLADGSVLSDGALAHRRTTPAHWWETLMQSAREFCTEQGLGYEALVVHTAAGGKPACLEITSAELPQPTVSNICTRGPVTSRLTQMVAELRAIDAALAPGTQYDLADALLVGLGHVRSVMACLLDRSCRWPGVLSEELAAVRCDLEDFAAEMFEPFARADQRRWGGVYLRGLLLDGGRKSVEPMAARLGEDGNRQALAHFVTSSPWDAAHVRARLAWRMQPVVKPTALVIDDTGFLKDGDASACVTRQYTGTAGKVTNCQAGLSLHLASNGASAAVNWRLFLPGSWDPASPKADPAKVARRDKCAIPAQVGHVEKWQLALDMIDETRSWGIEVPQVIADGGYGDTAAFRLGLETRGLDYVVGISTTTTAQTEDAQPCTPAYSGRGPRLVPAYPEPAQRVKSLVIAAGKSSARPVQWRQGSRPGSGRSGFKRMYSRFVALRIRPAGREIRKATATAELPVRWLLAEWPADQDEPVQFWLSNLPETTPLPVLVRTAKLRWRIENDYREMKQALGLAHFEGRTWPGWHHHVTLVSVAHAFCTLQRLSRSPKETASA